MTIKSPIINIMTKAAYKAGNKLIKDFREVENLQVSKKGVGDFVSTADFNSEETIINELQKFYPNIDIIAEETNPNINDNKSEKKFSHNALIKQSRLSVMPIDSKSWKLLCKMGCSKL